MSILRSLEPLAAVGLLLAVLAQRRMRPTTTQRRARAHRARAQRQSMARARAGEAACAQRFAVSACVEQVRGERRAALQQLDQQRALLDDAQRKRRAAERSARIRERQDARRASDESRQPPAGSSVQRRAAPRSARQPSRSAAPTRCACAAAPRGCSRDAPRPPGAPRPPSAAPKRLRRIAQAVEATQPRARPEEAAGASAAGAARRRASAAARRTQRRGTLLQRLHAHQRQRQVVAAAAGALARLGHQHLAGLARRQRVHDGADLARGEVVPQAVAARQHESPTSSVPRLAHRHRRVLAWVPRQPVSRFDCGCVLASSSVIWPSSISRCTRSDRSCG